LYRSETLRGPLQQASSSVSFAQNRLVLVSVMLASSSVRPQNFSHILRVLAFGIIQYSFLTSIARSFSANVYVDVLMVGMGQFSAGMVLFLKLHAPDLRVVIVDSSPGPGGVWQNSNKYDTYEFPLLHTTEMSTTYHNWLTGLPVHGEGLHCRDDIIRYLSDIYKWSGATLMFNTTYVGQLEGDGHVVDTPLGQKVLHPRVVIYPKYRDMNSFEDRTTRDDHLVRSNLTNYKGVKVLGNSVQAASAVNAIMKLHPSLKIEVYYRTPHYLSDYQSRRYGSEYLFTGSGKFDDVLDSLIERSAPSVAEYVSAFRPLYNISSEYDRLLSLYKQMPLPLLDASSGQNLKFTRQSSFDPQTVAADGWYVLDARNDVSNVPKVFRRSWKHTPATVHRPELGLRACEGCDVSDLLNGMLVQMRKEKYPVSVVHSGYQYARLLHHYDFNYHLNTAETKVMSFFYHFISQITDDHIGTKSMSVTQQRRSPGNSVEQADDVEKSWTCYHEYCCATR